MHHPAQRDIRDLYTRRLDAYAAFVGFFRSQNAISAMMARADVVKPDMVVLDAGCGFGLATFALADAMSRKRMRPRRIDAFDLTPAMLSRFHQRLAAYPDLSVQTHQADVLDQASLPESWTGYDLVISTSMLEYLPRAQLPQALAGLRSRMAPKGRIFVMITRRTLEAKFLIELAWHAERYSRADLVTAFEDAGFRDLQFPRFPLRHGWMNRANHVVVARV